MRLAGLFRQVGVVRTGNVPPNWTLIRDVPADERKELDEGVLTTGYVALGDLESL